MKKLLALKMIFLAVAFLPSVVLGQTSGAYDLGLSTLKDKITTQLEQIKATRQYAENQLSLARSRIEDEVSRSQEKLALQLESLDLLKQDLQTQGAQTQTSIAKMNSDLSTFSVGALKDIEDQIALTKNMLEQLKTLKGGAYADSSASNSASGSSGPGVTTSDIQTTVSSPVTSTPTETTTTVTTTNTMPVTSGST